jgi:hypothetical protein
MLDWIVQHIIASIPVALWALFVGVGIAGYFLSGFASKISAVAIYAKALRFISVAVFSGSLYMMGGSGVASLWQEQIKEKQAEVDAAVAQSNQENVQIKYVVQQQLKVVHDKQIVVKHDIQHDAQIIDAECKVAPEAIKDLNEATE